MMTISDIEVTDIEKLRRLDARRVADALRARRLLMRLSQAELAEKVGFHSAVVGRLETGSWYPRSERGFESLVLIANALELPIAVLEEMAQAGKEDAVIFPNWQGAQVVGLFQEFGEVVGLRIECGGQFASLPWETIENRLEDRWEEIGEELKLLYTWWIDQGTPKTAENREEYGRRDAAMQAERRHVEDLYQAVRNHPERARPRKKVEL